MCREGEAEEVGYRERSDRTRESVSVWLMRIIAINKLLYYSVIIMCIFSR